MNTDTARFTETVRFHENLMVSPTCSICNEIYHTKAYGGDLEFCPRCTVLGANYLKEIEIAELAHRAKLDNIRQRWRRKVVPEEEFAEM